MVFLITFTACESTQVDMQSQTENQQFFTYTDSELNLSDSEKYQLDITLSAHRLCFTISAGLRVLGFRYVVVKENTFNAGYELLKQCSEALDWNSNNFKEVRLFIQHELFTMVPEALFDASSSADYLSLIHKLPSNYEVLAVAAPKHQAVCVFSLPAHLLKSVKQLFNPSLISHQMLVFLQVADQFNNNDLKQRLLVDIEGRFVTILYYQNNDITFLNTFIAQTDTDITYFVLSVAELLKLAPDKCGVYLFGDISVTSSTIGLLKKYIPEVFPVSRMNRVSYPLSFREFQEQQHYLSIHSLLCE